MTRFLLFLFLLASVHFSYGQNPNLVSNGNVELFNNNNNSPTDWSSSSDFGSFNKNTTDFIEGASSVQFNPQFGELMMFTTVAIPLEAGKTYNIKYSYKFLGSVFDSNDNIKFEIYLTSSERFENFVSIENNNWNTVEAQYTPTITDLDSEVSIRVFPNNASFEYPVLFDDIQVVEDSGLSNQKFNLEEKVSILTLQNKQVKIEKSSDVKITDVTMFSILGQQKTLNSDSDDLTTYNLNAYSSGIYILKISTNKGNISKKIFIK